MLTQRIAPLAEVATGLPLAILEGTSETTATAIERHNAQAAALAESIANIDADVKRAVEAVADFDTADGSGFEFADALEMRQSEKLRLYQECGRLWHQRQQVAEAMRADLDPVAEAAGRAHATQLVKTIAGLDRLGLTTAAMQAASANPNAAVSQQLAIARQALPVRAAAAAEGDAKARRNAATEAAATSRRNLEAARAAVRAVAEKAAALV